MVFGEDGGDPELRVRRARRRAARRGARADACRRGARADADRGESAGLGQGGRRLDSPAEAGLDETHVSFTKGCYPGQEPIARLRHRGKVNRSLRVLEIDSAQPGDEVRHGEKVVGRVTSAVPGRALAYVRVEVPFDAELAVGDGSENRSAAGPVGLRSRESMNISGGFRGCRRGRPRAGSRSLRGDGGDDSEKARAAARRSAA